MNCCFFLERNHLTNPAKDFCLFGQKFGITIPKFFDLKKLDALEVLMAHNFYGLHPRNSKWIPKMMVCKRCFLANVAILSIYPKFQRGIKKRAQIRTQSDSPY